MNDFIKSNWKLDHIGHVVENIDESIEFYEEIFGFELVHREELETVELAFLAFNNSKIELIAPIDHPSLEKFLEKKGEGLHHICFEVENLREELSFLKERGIELVDAIPRRGAENREIAFLSPQSTKGVLIELCSKPLLSF